MKRIRRILATVGITLFAVSQMSGKEREWNVEVDGFKYCILDSCALQLTIVDTLKTGAVDVPSMVKVDGFNDSLPVIEINEGAFASCSHITKVTVPHSVKKMGMYTFGGCPMLKELDLSQSQIEGLPDWMCYGDTKIESIKFPQMLTYISELSMSGQNFEELIFPDALTGIGERAFSGCPKLRKVHFGNNLQDIFVRSFAYCVNLSEVNWPESLTSIELECFVNTALTEITIPKSITNIHIGYGTINTLRTVKCYVDDPAKIDAYYAFGDTDLSKCVLWVPYGSKALYEASEEWNRFGEIREMDQSSANEIEADKATADTIYDLNGRKVDTPRNGGIYIVNGKKTAI